MICRISRSHSWMAVVVVIVCTTGAVSAQETARLKVRHDLQVEDFGTILRARTVTGPIVYKEPTTGRLHFNCSLEAMNGLTAADGM